MVMSHAVQLSESTFSRLQRLAIPLVDTIESVIEKLIDYRENEHSDQPQEPDTHGSTESEEFYQLPEKAFRIPLLETMYELGGKAHPDEVKRLQYAKVVSLLGPGDLREASAGGPRWWHSTQWNRNHMKNEGLFKSDSRKSIWELTDEGINYAEALISSRKPNNDLQSDTRPRPFNAKSVPNLKHTKLLSAKVGGETIRPTWNGLLAHLIRLVPKDRLASAEEARRLILANFVVGKKEDEGYRFMPELGISVQGQDAIDSWKGASHLAQKLGVPVEVEFLWRMKEGAAFPGVTGRLSV
jgi:Mrr N-terminal domain